MNKVTFAKGVRPTVGDMNAIGTTTEEALDQLIRALLSTETGNVLFDAAPPTVSVLNDVLTVTVPSQWFVVAGAVQKTQEVIAQFNAGANNLRIDVYLVAGKTGQNETRDFNSVDPTTGYLIQQTLTTQIRQNDAPRVEFVTGTDILLAPTPPALSSADVGRVRLAIIRYVNLSNSFTVDLNTTERYVLPPGAVAGLTAHAISHLPGGADAIQVATVSGDTSTAGLMPVNSLVKVQASIQDLAVAGGSEFLTISTSVDREVEVGVRIADSLTIEDIGGQQHLAAAFLPPSQAAGFSSSVARADHTHTSFDSGFLVQVTELDVTGNLGTILPISFLSQTQGQKTLIPKRILSVDCFWEPANQTNTNNPKGVHTGWTAINTSGANATVGARALITGPSTFEIEIGELGATFLSAATKNKVASPTWTSPAYNQGSYPTSGKLRIVAVAQT